MIKIKKAKKSKGMSGRHGHGAKWRGSGKRGGIGMAGTGKRADHRKTLVTKLYGNKYFGKQGITSKGTKRKKFDVMNLREIVERYKGKTEIELKKYKILGDGELKIKLTITAKAFTKIAKEKIEKAGGKAVVIEVKRKIVKAKASKDDTLNKEVKKEKSE